MTAARIVITLLLLAQIAPVARAAWVPDGNILTAYRGDVANPQLAPDGRGGVFVTWLDDTKAPFVSRLAGDGTYPPDWPSAGRYAVAKYRLDGYVQGPTVVADGLGGCYVVWVHASEGCISFCGILPGRVYVQRLESSSAIARGWPEQGLVVSQRVVDAPFQLHAIPDGSHGLIIATDRWAQRVQPDAKLAWGNGVGFESGTGAPSTLVTDGSGGAFVFWTLDRVMGQHVRAGGSLDWGAAGLPISTESARGRPSAIAVGSDAVVAWIAPTGTDWDIVATRVTARGELAWVREKTIRSNASFASEVLVAGAPREAIVLAWQEFRPDLAIGASDLVALKLDRDGRLRWSSTGIRIGGQPGRRTSLTMAPDGEGGVFLAWAEKLPQSEYFATRIDAQGLVAPLWASTGAPLSKAPESNPDTWVRSAAMVATAPGHAIVAWHDVRDFPGGPPSVDVSLSTRLDLGGPAAYARGEQPFFPRLQRLDSVTMPQVVQTDRIADGRVRCTLSEGGEATLEVFDVAGRRIADQTWLATRGEVERLLSTGARLAPGLYLVRLRQRENVATTRALVLR